jgi:hypothetical protein
LQVELVEVLSMSRLRAFLIALTILAMAVAPVLVPSVGLGSPNGSQAYAAISAAPMNQDDDGDNDDDDDDDGDNDDGDNDDGDDNDNDDGDDNDNDDGDDDDDDDDPGPVGPAPSQSSAPASPPPPACSTPGQEMSFQTADSRITVRVFGSMTQSLKFSIRHPIDPASVPPAPGPVVGGLLFQLIAETCDGSPVAVLPAEVNLGVRYSDGDAAGLNEANFTLARLDTSANQWRAAQKQATDPPNNFTSATITEMGFYVLHQRS